MPHLFTNRPRQHHLASSEPAGSTHFSWEAFNSAVYLIGGVIFIVGSILFLPSLDNLANVGVWVFIVGSLLYLIVTGHDWLESAAYNRSQAELTIWNRLEFLSANVYLIGTILFTVGSVLFLSQFDRVAVASWCFILGAILFLVGALINMLQIVQASTMITLQLTNLTAVCYAIGSALFVAGSVPYLWTIRDQADGTLLFTFVAWEFITGSFLFFLGGVFNYFRAFRVAAEGD